MTVVVFKKRETGKAYLAVFTDSKITPDVVIDSAKRKPPIPHNWILEEIGVGKGLVDMYKKKYKIEKVLQDPLFNVK